jgi:hypothetical protein
MRTARTLEPEWRQVLRRKHEYGGKGRWVKYWACSGCWISPCYSPFSLGGCFETYELFTSLIFQFFGGRGKPRITETVCVLNQWIRGHTYTYVFISQYHSPSGNAIHITRTWVQLGHLQTNKPVALSKIRYIWRKKKFNLSLERVNKLAFLSVQ